MQVQYILVVDCDSHHHSYEFKLHVRFKCVSVEPHHPRVFFVREHCVVWIEQFPYEKLEKLFLDSSLINS